MPIVKLVKAQHHEKAEFEIVVTLSEIITIFKPEQCSKASFPIVVTLLPIFKLVKLEQLKNAHYPIDVTLSGITTDVIVLLSSNALLYILVTGTPLYVSAITIFFAVPAYPTTSAYVPSAESS